ncbi:hypothetical protein H0H87_003070 [Tephrocybe sp. NHM501043]|nr:hypothetical protein H0H87_003070 [Tephrocybe sp. NHM501043]
MKSQCEVCRRAGQDAIPSSVPLLTTSNHCSSERDCAAPEPIHVPPTHSAIAPASSPPERVAQLREAWYRYLDSRVVEWKIAATTACVFVAASPTIFQIPDASDDPITRSIAFFALCRAVSGMVYGPIFPIYFRTARERSAHFAMLWAQVRFNIRSNFDGTSSPRFRILSARKTVSSGDSGSCCHFLLWQRVGKTFSISS